MPHFKKILVSLIAALGITSATAAFAYMEHEDITHRWGVGFSTMGAIPTSDEADVAFYGGANVTYGLMDYIAVTMDVGYTKMQYGAFGSAFGELESVPLIFSLQFRYPYMLGQTKTAAYLLAGAGVMFRDFSSNNDPLVSTPNVNDALAYKLGGGFDFFVDDHWVVNLETSMIFVSDNVHLSVVDGSQEMSSDSDYWQLGGGAKYFF